MLCTTKSFVFIGVLGLFACLGTVVAQPMCSEGLKEQLKKEIVLFKPSAATRSYNTKIDSEHRNYDVITGSLLVPHPKKAIHVNYINYQAKGASPRFKAPLLLIYSGIGGATAVDHAIARYFVKQNFLVVISHYVEGDSMQYIDKMRESSIRNIKAGFALIDFFLQQRSIDPSKIAVLGISYGGTRALYHTLVDHRIKAASLIVAGLPLAEVLLKSKLNLVKKMRRTQMKNARIKSLGEYARRLQLQLNFPVNDYMCLRKSDDFYLFMSKHDSWVPSSNQLKLWQTLGQPSFKSFQFGHVGVPIWVCLNKMRRIKNFFQSRWQHKQIS